MEQKTQTNQQERRKSKLQLVLEKAGWKFLTDDFLPRDTSRSVLPLTTRMAINSTHDILLKRKYENDGREVLVAESYDNNGRQYPIGTARAIYVRETSKKNDDSSDESLIYENNFTIFVGLANAAIVSEFLQNPEEERKYKLRITLEGVSPERKKSPLQLALEEAGWGWLTDASIDKSLKKIQPSSLEERMLGISLNDMILREKHGQNYANVLVAEAHDYRTRPYPAEEARAIYVKGTLEDGEDDSSTYDHLKAKNAEDTLKYFHDFLLMVQTELDKIEKKK